MECEFVGAGFVRVGREGAGGEALDVEEFGRHGRCGGGGRGRFLRLAAGGEEPGCGQGGGEAAGEAAHGGATGVGRGGHGAGERVEATGIHEHLQGEREWDGDWAGMAQPGLRWGGVWLGVKRLGDSGARQSQAPTSAWSG